MNKRQKNARTASAYSWNIDAMDTADRADRHTTTSKPHERRIGTQKSHYSIADWIACICWLPLGRSNESNTH